MNKPILIIGGGISGITAAVEIAETGHDVILTEKLPYLGGRVAKLNRYFPKLCPPNCGLEINFRRIKNNSRVKIYTSTKINNISGSKGDFTVSIKTEPEYVNGNCTSCGECEKICPAERQDEFNYNINRTKAIYLPHEMAFPYKHTIDSDFCEKDSCKKCLEVCKYDAINLNKQPEETTINVHSVIYATGWQPYDAAKIDNLKFGKYPDIITNVMMERLTAPNGPTQGKLLCPSDNRIPETVAFIQCAGSRDENHLTWCSGVCCSATLKQAMILRELYPDIKVKIFYIDLRVSGRNEDMLKKVEADPEIELIKGKTAGVEEDTETKGLIIETEDVLSNIKRKDHTDMIVLATGIVPSETDNSNIKFDDHGFVNEQLLKDGIFVAGCAKRPMDVSASLKDATGAALKAIQNNVSQRLISRRLKYRITNKE